jgi:Flp pilus assembly protein TadD
MKIAKILIAAAISLSLAGCVTGPRKPGLNDEKNPQHQYEKAVLALRYGLPEEALKYAELAISLDDGHYPSHFLLALIHMQKKNFSQAAAALEKCVELRPDSAEARSYLGAVYLELGQQEKAEAVLLISFSLDGNPRAGFNLAKLYFQRKEFKRALEYIDKTAEKAARDAAVYNFKGVILNELERYPEAALSYQAALAVAPNDPNVMINLGIAYLNNGEKVKARQAFEEALSLIKDPALQEKVNGYLKLIKEPCP